MEASEIIRRVREIQVRTGRQVADVLAGEYVSVFKGGGVEFEEVRPYVPGDDVRSIDWNVTARTGEPFVKRYVEERQLTLLLMADVSASMDFGSAERSKREAAAELCALLAFSAIRNDDKVGLVLFHGGVEQYIPPRKGQKHALRVVREVLAHGEMAREGIGHGTMAREVPARGEAGPGHPASKTNDRDAAAASRGADPAPTVRDADSRKTSLPQPGPLRRLRDGLFGLGRLARGARTMRTGREATDISRAMRFAMSVTKRRAVCFVVSDFLDEGFEQALLTANQKHDVIAVLVTDRRELEAADVGLVTVEDAETGRALLVDSGSAAVRRHLDEEARRRVADLERRLRRVGIDFIHIDAAGSVVDPIVRFFRMRERRKHR